MVLCVLRAILPWRSREEYSTPALLWAKHEDINIFKGGFSNDQ